MVFGEVAQARMEPADQLQRTIASITSFVGREPSVHGVTNEGCHRTPSALRPRTEGPSRVVRELDLHTCHVQTIAVVSIVMAACVRE
jgi:hypothetical protein